MASEDDLVDPWKSSAHLLVWVKRIYVSKAAVIE